MYLKSELEPEPGPAGPSGSSTVPWSLAGRLTAWFIFVNAILLSLATTFLYWSLVAHLDEEDLEHFEERLTRVRSALQKQPVDPVKIRAAVRRDPLSFEPVYARVISPDGSVLGETEGLPDWMETEVYARTPAPASRERPLSVRGPDGRPFKLLSARVPAGAGNGASYLVQMALDHESEARLLGKHRRNVILTLIFGLVVSAFVGNRIAHHGTLPLGKFAESMRRISASTLSERLSTRGRPAELTAIVESFNNMLGRLEYAFVRESQFAADIAHELRNPLNNLRGEIEVALNRNRNPDEYRNTLSSCLEECQRLSHMIDRLLFLARAENPATQIQRAWTDIGGQLAGIREFYAASAQEAGIALQVEAPSNLFAGVDPGLLQRAVVNLVENALAHTDSGGCIVMTAQRESDQLKVTVRDTGQGIESEHLPRIFDRLYRVDVSRTRGTGGAGLGLSIVKSVAELHGGTVDIDSKPGQGTSITLHFPQLPENRER